MYMPINCSGAVEVYTLILSFMLLRLSFVNMVVPFVKIKSAVDFIVVSDFAVFKVLLSLTFFL